MGFLDNLFVYDLDTLTGGRIEITGVKIIVQDLTGGTRREYEKKLNYHSSRNFERGFYISVRERFLEDCKEDIELRDLYRYGDIKASKGEFTITCSAEKKADLLIPNICGDILCKYVFKIDLNGKPMLEKNVRSFWAAQRVSSVSFF